MRRFTTVPLAWLNLTHDWRALALSSAGIGFAVVLMCVQYGFRNALLDANVLLVEHFNADLVLLSRQEATVANAEGFTRRRIAQAQAVPGVRSVHPLYVEYTLSLLQSAARDGEQRPPGRSIRVLGVDPDAGLLDFPELNPSAQEPRSRVAELKVPGRFLFDRRCKRNLENFSEPIYGPLAAGSRTELAGQEIWIAGSFDLGSDFAADGTLIASTETFGRLLRQPFYPGGEFDQVDFGLVRCEPGSDPAVVQAALRSALSEGEVDVLTPRELIARERQYWLDSTPIGYVFGFGMLLGFVVGMVICYQILSSDVADHVAEYATLKAIGYSNGYLSRLVLQQALLLAVAGFLPGVLVSLGLYRLMELTTDLPMRLTPGRAGWIFLLTVAMCAGSGLLALNKVKRVDPAEVF